MQAMVDWNLVSIIIFYSLLCLFFYIKRRNVVVQSKILFLYKTKFFNRVIKQIAASMPRFWRAFGYLAIPAGFIGMILIFTYLTYALIKLFVAPPEYATISLVIPGVHIPGSPIFVPFWYGILALFVVVLVHEGMHGVVAEAFKNKIKSAGVGVLAILPLAFVEPDEKKLSKQPAKTQLAIFSAGPFANFVTAGLVLLLASFLVAPLVSTLILPTGLAIDSVTAGQPAYLAGLQKGQIITQIDSQNISATEDFVNYMKNVAPGQALNIVADGKTYALTTIENPKDAGKPLIGVIFKQNLAVAPELAAKYGSILWLPWYLLQLLSWIFLLNLGIGLINLLPLGAVDGGRMASVALACGFRNKEKAKKLFSFLSLASLVLLLANLIGPYILKAF